MTDRPDVVSIECLGIEASATPTLTEETIARLRAKATEIESLWRQGFRIASIETPFTNVMVVMERPKDWTPNSAAPIEILDYSIKSHNDSADPASIRVSERTYNALHNANITTVRDLVKWSARNILKVKNFGKKSLEEVKKALNPLGLDLGMKID